MEADAGHFGSLFRARRAVSLGAKPRESAGNERGRPGGDSGSTGRRVPQFHQLDWECYCSGRCRGCGRGRGCFLASRTRCWPLACSRCRTPGRLRAHPVDRVLDREWNRRRAIRGGGTRLQCGSGRDLKAGQSPPISASTWAVATIKMRTREKRGSNGCSTAVE